MRAPETSELLGAYDAYDRNIRLRFSRVLHVLVIALVPAGTSLDWFVYPELLNELFVVRVSVATITGLALLVHHTAFVKRHIRWFGMLVPLLVSASIAWMVLRTEGATSPYYAGLCLVLTGIGVLLPWSFREALVACLFTLGSYLAACLFHPESLANVSIFFSNLYFLVLTCVICVTAAYFKNKARFAEFRLSSELAKSYAQLSELERHKTEFFANVSHELRTPLTLILAPLSDVLGRAEALPAATSQLVKLAHDNALRLLKLISELLGVIRLEDQEFRLRLESLELGAFACDLAESMRQLARLKRLTLTVERPAEALWVMADPTHLEKVIVNLVSNAIKFTPKGGSVWVTARQQGTSVEVVVRDDGIGIAEADQRRVFDRFRQADASETRRFPGLGIGLALAKELAEAHEGSLGLVSGLGAGSTFTLRLPVHEAPRVELPEPDERVPPSDRLAELFRSADRFVALEDPAESEFSRAESGTHRSVLVIDDEPDMRRYLLTVLGDDYAVLEARDGVEGLELARLCEPDLVLLDLMMPDMDGWRVCTTLKQQMQDSAPKVMVLSARTDEAAKIAALEAGADDFLNKPFSTLEVRTRLANLHRTRALETDLRMRNEALATALEKLGAAETELVQREKMKAVVRMAGGILHEINNPLNYTLTAASLALDRCPANDGELREILMDVQAGMIRVRDIVTDLRAFADPGSSTRRDLLELDDVVEQALRFTAHELEGIRVELSIEKPCPIYGSRSELIQVLTNLLLNAASAVHSRTAEHQGTIGVFGQVRGDHTHVEVRDNGTGITADLLEKIFDPFVTTREVGRGMGLGLSICHTLITAHGGEIAVRSQEGSWTEVRLELPLHQTEVAA